MNFRRALKPDAQAFDEVRITTVPRWKTSGLSGDEWRISAKIEFLRKGKVVAEGGGCRDIQTACGVLMSRYFEAVDNGNGLFAGEQDTCDQEGCSKEATVTYRIKREYSRDRPHEWNREINEEIVFRRFCDEHKRRGDCGFDDSDENYELLSPILASVAASTGKPEVGR